MQDKKLQGLKQGTLNFLYAPAVENSFADLGYAYFLTLSYQTKFWENLIGRGAGMGVRGL